MELYETVARTLSKVKEIEDLIKDIFHLVFTHSFVAQPHLVVDVLGF